MSMVRQQSAADRFSEVLLDASSKRLSPVRCSTLYFAESLLPCLVDCCVLSGVDRFGAVK
jgi:hypothetical protein